MNNTNNVNVARTNRVNVVGANTNNELPFDLMMPPLEDISTFNFSSDHEDNDKEADINNMDITIQVSPTSTIRIHKDHPLDQVIGDLHSTTKIRNMSKNLEEHRFCSVPYGVKSAFLYGKIEEEVYVKKPPGFEDHDFADKVKNASTIMETQKPLLKDEDREEVDVHIYRSMSGSLMYLTSSRLDIMFAVCACAIYQVNPKVSHLHAVKRIFRVSITHKIVFNHSNTLESQTLTQFHHLSSKPNTMSNLKFAEVYNLVAFLSKPNECEGFEQIVDFLNADPILYTLTINPIVYTSCIEKLWATVKAKTIHGEGQLQDLVDGKKVIITESTIRRDLQLEDAEGVDCLSNAKIFEQLTFITYEKISQKLNFIRHSIPNNGNSLFIQFCNA
nr:ribonuclease H-like domain, reverse transcriptase, RNA-dependent DNA polymerase [Tanacetum cinerariifolium]